MRAGLSGREVLHGLSSPLCSFFRFRLFFIQMRPVLTGNI